MRNRVLESVYSSSPQGVRIYTCAPPAQGCVVGCQNMHMRVVRRVLECVCASSAWGVGIYICAPHYVVGCSNLHTSVVRRVLEYTYVHNPFDCAE